MISSTYTSNTVIWTAFD